MLDARGRLHWKKAGVNLPERILFVGAHCDDVELFGGGLLARACFSRRHVGVLVFSDHRGVLNDNLSWLSAESGGEVRNHSGPMLPACSGAFQSERGALYAAMESLRDHYDLVVTHASTDTNQDHRQVAEEAARVFKAHATLLGGEFPNNDLGAFKPQVYFALSPRELDAKVRMVTQYRSQDVGGRPYLDAEVVRAQARMRGSQIREPAAEAFTIVGRIVIRAAS
jgi:LmbE family N-acetylglucosaminyl deacetylase